MEVDQISHRACSSEHRASLAPDTEVHGVSRHQQPVGPPPRRPFLDRETVEAVHGRPPDDAMPGRCGVAGQHRFGPLGVPAVKVRFRRSEAPRRAADQVDKVAHSRRDDGRVGEDVGVGPVAGVVRGQFGRPFPFNNVAAVEGRAGYAQRLCRLDTLGAEAGEEIVQGRHISPSFPPGWAQRWTSGPAVHWSAGGRPGSPRLSGRNSPSSGRTPPRL